MKEKTKAEKIRKLLSKGKTVKQIIEMTGATPSYVYRIRMELRNSIGVSRSTPKVRIEPEMIEDIIAQHEAKKSWWQRLKELVC